MDKKEADFQASLLSAFKTEAEEHIKAISDGLLELEKTPEPKKNPALDLIFREAHSLKGAARSVNYETVQSLCQSLENVLAAWKQGKIQTSKHFFDTLYKTGDLIGKLIKSPPKKEEKEDTVALIDLLERLDQLIIAKQEKAIEQELKKDLQEVLQEEKIPQEVKSPVYKSGEATIRVRLQKLDNLFQEVEEMLMVKLAFQQQMSNLKSLQSILNEWDKKRGNVALSIMALKKFGEERGGIDFLSHTIDFIDWISEYVKSIKEQHLHLVKTTSQDQRLAASSIDSLLDDARKMLMQPLSTILDVFPRMVRDISLAQGKNVNLEIIGGDIEVDRRVLEEMKDPITHLIRNSIDHGIEAPSIRAKTKKPTVGTITIKASEIAGNAIELLISDDGGGIDCEKVKESAIKQGSLSREEGRKLSEQESMQFILKSGISTSPIITDLSGRGLGLGIVSEKVDALGGQLFIESKLGLSTLFRIVLPLTLATFRGVHIKAADQDYIIPSHHVVSVIRINIQDLKRVENQEIVNFEGKAIPVIPLKNLLGIFSPTANSPARTSYAVVLKAMDKTIAFTVDEVINEQEVLVKGLGKQLKSLRNIMSVSITDSGRIIPILNPRDLIQTAKVTATSKTASQEEIVKNPEKKTILVVEDSMTTRILLKNILESAGFAVKTAIDGVEGFGLYNSEAFNLVITDIEMPKMDGFVLTSKIRNSDKGKGVPIILCTSRDSPEDKERGINAGANVYMEKSRFTQGHLLEIVQKLI